MKPIGIVLVSHVPEIVAGIARLINEVAPDVSVTLAGGTDDNEIGTSFTKIDQAFNDNQGEKILAFYDLGSAKMNLEMAMELTAKEVTFYDTALLESSYTAAALLQADASLSDIEKQLEPLVVK